MGHIRIRISKKQAKELIQQFQKDSSFDFHKSKDDEYYTIIPKKGCSIIHIYKFGKYYYLEIFS